MDELRNLATILDQQATQAVSFANDIASTAYAIKSLLDEINDNINGDEYVNARVKSYVSTADIEMLSLNSQNHLTQATLDAISKIVG